MGMPMEFQQYIASFFELTQEQSIQLSSLFTCHELNKGDYFLTAGKTCNKLGFIKSGILRIYATTESKEITQWISTPGYFVTDLAGFIFETPSRWTIQALAPTELYTIDRETYSTLKSVIPLWAESEKLFLTKCFVMLENRILSLLSLSAEERYHLFFEHNRELFNQVPLQYIASMLGMTPETFSRIRKKQLAIIS